MGCGSSTSAAPLGVVPQAATVASGSSYHNAPGKEANHNNKPTPGANANGTHGAAVSSAASDAISPPVPPVTPKSNENGVGANPNALPRGSSRVYSQEHASSVPAPRVSLSKPVSVSRVETERVRGAKSSKEHDTMPAVSELLVSFAIPIRGALLPNFYRSAAFSAGGSKGDAEATADSYDSSMEWSDEEEEMDEEEHRETMDMLRELTALSVPSPGLKKHHSSSGSDGPPPSVHSCQQLHGSPESKEAIADGSPPPAKQTPTSKHKPTGSTASPILPSAAGVPVHGSTLALPGQAASSSTSASPRSSNTRQTKGRAFINSAGTETLFHGFYAKRCIHTVKKSMASSGLYLTFKEMFERLDPTHSGVISRADWAQLLQKLGLPVDSATSLSRMVGLADTPTITLEQFATVMALSMHGPYVRLLQSTQNAKRNELFLGGDKSASHWRKEAMMILARNKVAYFNPAPADLMENPSQSDAAPWNAELVILEALAKTQCQMMLFVVDDATRSIAAMVEASEHITSEKEVILVMQNVAGGTNIAGEILSPAEAKDLNRGRAYLADVAHRNAHSGVSVFKTVAEACEYIGKRVRGEVTRPSLKAFTKPVIALPTAMPPSTPSSAHIVTTPVASTASTPSSSSSSSSASVAPSATPAASLSASHSSSTANLPPVPPSKLAPRVPALVVPQALPVSTPQPISSHAAPASDGAFSVPAGSPLSLSLMSNLARRHSTGVSPPAQVRRTSGVPSPNSRHNPAYSAAFAGLSPVAPSPAATPPPAAGFPSEWPEKPQPADFDKYLASPHFLECARIVFKHQGLLSRRAAVKAAQQQQQLSTVPSSQELPSAAAQPPGLFRMASSPFSPLKLMKTSGSASNLQLAELVPRIVLPPQQPAPNASHGGPLHIVTSSPSASPVASNRQVEEKPGEDPAARHHLAANGQGEFSPTASRSQSGSADTMLSESFSGGAIASALSQTRVLVRMASQSQQDDVTQVSLKDSYSSPDRTLSLGPNVSPSATRPTTSDAEPAVAPSSPAQAQTQPQAQVQPTLAGPEDDQIPAGHLFTMLIRLHEIIQLSTGITFLHPYPNLVAAETNGTSSQLHLSDWVAIARNVFGKLRGIHEPEPLSRRSTLEREQMAAATTTATTAAATTNMPGTPNAEKPISGPGEYLVTVSTDQPAPTPSGSKRRSMRMTDPGSPMVVGNRISPSQFLRNLGQNKRASGGTPVQPSEALHVPAATTWESEPHVPSAVSTATVPSSRVTISSARTGTPEPAKIVVVNAAAGATATGTAPAVEKPKPSLSHTLALIQKVKSRISAQRKVIELMTPRGRSPLDEANTLSESDMAKLAASVQASLQHDQLCLKEMLPSFQGMFSSIDQAKKGSVGMADVEYLLEKKLALPKQSCESLMAVINVALKSCEHEASDTSSHALAKTSDASGSPLPEPLAPSAFDRNNLTYQAFCAVLSKTLHLQSSPFSSFLSSDKSFLTRSKKVCSQVFLGGSCNPTTWRTDEAIPILSSQGVTFYNPQVDGWSEELVLIESLIKQNCEILLFVIDSETRAIASMIEAAEYICSGRDVVLVVKNLPLSDAKVNNESLGPQQVHELNRARSYVTDVAQRHGLDVFTDITLACEYICTKLHEKQSKEEAYSNEVESFISSDEFIEKSFEEFVRCDTKSHSRLNVHQLLLACLHLEQDLRPLLPPQSAKHRQPSTADAEIIMKQFASPGKLEIEAEQFLDFSRVLFRNVCAHVKL